MLLCLQRNNIQTSCSKQNHKLLSALSLWCQLENNWQIRILIFLPWQATTVLGEQVLVEQSHRLKCCPI